MPGWSLRPFVGGVVASVLCGLVLIGSHSVAWADEPNGDARQVYKAVGGPAQPKVHVFWNQYHDHAQITKMLHDLSVAYPQLFKVQSIGKSTQGRDMWVATITNFEVGDA